MPRPPSGSPAPDSLSDIFSYYGRRPNQFFLRDLEELLCPPADEKSGARAVKLAIGATHRLEDATGQKASFSLSLSADKKELSLDVRLVRDGRIHDSRLRAVKVREDNLYEITSLTFDNKPEKLKHRWEISAVLGFLGKNHLAGIAANKIPAPHQERGQFGKFGRFFNRMLADNPHMMIYPPYF